MLGLRMTLEVFVGELVEVCAAGQRDTLLERHSVGFVVYACFS